MKKLIFILVPIIMFSSGCSGPQSSISKAQSITIGEITSIHSPSEYLVTYVTKGDSALRFCSQTNIDSVQTSSSGISAAVGAAGSTEELGEQSSVGDVTLGGRDSAVLLTRELMYRACEFTSNANLKNEDAIKVYAATLDAVIKISLSQTIAGSKALDAEPQVHPIILPPVPQTTKSSGQSKRTVPSSVVSKDASGDPSQSGAPSLLPQEASATPDQTNDSGFDYVTPQHYQ